MNQPSHVIVPVPGCGEVIFQFTRDPGGPAMVTLTGTLRVNRTDLRIEMLPTRWDTPTVDVGLRKVREKKWGDKPSAATQEKATAIVNQVWTAAHTDPMIDAETLADAAAFKAAQGRYGYSPSERLADCVEVALQGMVRVLQARHARDVILSGVPARDVDPTPPISADDLLAELRSAAEWATAPAEHRWDAEVDDVGMVRVLAHDAESAEAAALRLYPGANVQWVYSRATNDD